MPMNLRITPPVVSAPESAKGQDVVFRAMFSPKKGVADIDITDKAEWESSNPLVLMFITKRVVRDPQGRVVGTEAVFRFVNKGTAKVTAFAQGLKATAKVDVGVKVPMPTPVPREPSDTHLWVSFGITGFAFLFGVISAMTTPER